VGEVCAVGPGTLGARVRKLPLSVETVTGGHPAVNGSGEVFFPRRPGRRRSPPARDRAIPVPGRVGSQMPQLGADQKRPLPPATWVWSLWPG